MWKKFTNLFKKSKPAPSWLEHHYLKELEWFDEYIARQSGQDALDLEKFRWGVRDLIERLYVYELEYGRKNDRQR